MGWQCAQVARIYVSVTNYKHQAQEVTPQAATETGSVLITVPQHSAVPTPLIYMTTQVRVFPVPYLKFIYAQNSLGKEDSLTTAQLHKSATPFSTSFSAAHLGVCNISGKTY